MSFKVTALESRALSWLDFRASLILYSLYGIKDSADRTPTRGLQPALMRRNVSAQRCSIRQAIRSISA